MNKEIRKVYEKPDNCPSCYEVLSCEVKPLVCGHWVHVECLKKQCKAECPICRRKLNIKLNKSNSDLEYSSELYNSNNIEEYEYNSNNIEEYEYNSDSDEEYILFAARQLSIYRSKTKTYYSKI